MAPTIGETLRKARKERGVELSEVERATKIRAKFLEAMEEDRWGALPAPVYARGFLDIYARYLGLDQEALLEEYRQTVEGEQHEPIPQSVIKPGTLRQTRPVGRTRSINWAPVAKVLAGVIVVAVVGLVIVGSIGGSDDSGGSDKGAQGEGSGEQGSRPVLQSDHHHDEHRPRRRGLGRAARTAPVWVCLVDDGGTPLGRQRDAERRRGARAVPRRWVRRYPRERLGRDDGGRRAGSDSAGRGAARLPDHTDRVRKRSLLTAHLRLRSGDEYSPPPGRNRPRSQVDSRT